MGDEPERPREDGHEGRSQEEPYTVLRPEFAVLGEEAVIPRDNVVRPPPNRFGHVLADDRPYWFAPAGQAGAPDGTLIAGTAVAVLRDEEDRCRVVTGSGLYVAVERAGLRELPQDHP